MKICLDSVIEKQSIKIKTPTSCNNDYKNEEEKIMEDAIKKYLII